MPEIDVRYLILFAALVFDGVLGDPPWLWRRIPHPVMLMGWLIGMFDRGLNRETLSSQARRLCGIAAALALPALWAGIGLAMTVLLGGLPFGWLIEAVIVAVFLAQRSLYDHVAAVAIGLDDHGLHGGRVAVARIVGRDPETLDEHGVGRAAVESLAENSSDGVISPVFWYLVAGLPGLLAFKAINTADSMVGHRTPRHCAYGWASARIDDLANLVPARLCGLLIVAVAALGDHDARGAFEAIRRDASRHTSPNAGWPEAAMAGALGLALAGPRLYRGRLVAAAFMNDRGRLAVTPADIRAALRLFRGACLVQAGVAGGVAAVLYVVAT